MKFFTSWKKNSFLFRIYLVHALFLMVASAILARLFVFQIKEHKEYAARAESQHERLEEIEALRGEILFREKDGTLRPAAITKSFWYVYAVPNEITDVTETATTLAKLLDIDVATLYRKLAKSDDPYELIARRIEENTLKSLNKLKLKGIYIGQERFRFYPSSNLASHVIGFVSLNGEHSSGKYGLEAQYEETLRGKPGKVEGVRDASGNVFMKLQRNLPSNGASIILTIDPNIQFRAEQILNETVKTWNALSGNVIVLDADTGAVRAMANVPSFDPNNFGKEKNLNVFVNSSVSHRFEPGSVFKAVTIAAGLETNAITPDTTYVDTGEIRIGSYIIRNSDLKAHGRINMTKVLEESYNTGAVFVMRKIGQERFREFLTETLRLPEKTGIDLPVEVKNDFSGLFPPYGRSINFATAAFGQGIAITPVKLAQIFAMFANGGNIVKPYVVAGIQSADGTFKALQPYIIARKVLSVDTLSNLNMMLSKVIEEGTGKRAKIKGYTIAGKTGTAQVPNPNGRGYTDETIHTFIAYTPSTTPRLVVIMKVDSPKGVRFAEGSVVPAVRRLFEFLFQYYEIPPDRPEELTTTPIP